MLLTGFNCLGSRRCQELQAEAERGPGLADVLAPEAVVPLLVQEGMLERLAPHLPEEHRYFACRWFHC